VCSLCTAEKLLVLWAADARFSSAVSAFFEKKMRRRVWRGFDEKTAAGEIVVEKSGSNNDDKARQD
jgi:hypothetical protein